MMTMMTGRLSGGWGGARVGAVALAVALVGGCLGDDGYMMETDSIGASTSTVTSAGTSTSSAGTDATDGTSAGTGTGTASASDSDSSSGSGSTSTSGSTGTTGTTGTTEGTTTSGTTTGDTTTGGDGNWPPPDFGNMNVPCPEGYVAASLAMGGMVCAPACMGEGKTCPAGESGTAEGVCAFNPDSSGDACKMGDMCMKMGETCEQTGGGDYACMLPVSHCALFCDKGESCPDGMQCFGDLVCQYPSP